MVTKDEQKLQYSQIKLRANNSLHDIIIKPGQDGLLRMHMADSVFPSLQIAFNLHKISFKGSRELFRESSSEKSITNYKQFTLQLVLSFV